MKKKFLPALRGLFLATFKEKSTRLQFVIFFVGLCVGAWFQFTIAEWLLFSIASVLVIGFEIVNSAIEEVCNLIDPNYNEKIKKIKDLMAGAVLMVSILAAIVACYLISRHIC